MRNKFDKKLLIIGVIVATIFLSIGGYFIYRLTKQAHRLPSVDDDKPVQTMNPGKMDKPEAKHEGIQIDVMDSKFYEVKNAVDFNFYIVTLNVTNNDAINLDLSTFKTSEGLTLDNVDKYVSVLEENQLFLGKENVVYQLVSLNKQSLFNIFVPVTKDNNNIVLYSDLDKDLAYQLDSKHNVSDVNLLYYEADDVISDGKTYQLKVSEAFDSTGLYFTQNINGNISQYIIPSTVSIFTFKLDVVSLFGDDVVIESATYIPNNYSDVFNALNSSIQCEKYANILGQKINDNGVGYLFFEAFNNPSHEVFYSGELHLKIKDSNTDIVVQVDLHKEGY